MPPPRSPPSPPPPLPPTPNFQDAGTLCDFGNFVATPHQPWAKPLDGGPLKVLFVGEASKARDCFELVQRLDAAPAILASLNINKETVQDGESFKQVSAALVDRLRDQRPEVVVLFGYGWNLLEPAAREALMAYVKDGGGLLLVNPLCHGVPGANMLYYGSNPRFGWRTTAEGKAVESLVAPLSGADAAFLDAIPWTNLNNFKETFASQSPENLFRGGRLGNGRLLVYDLKLGFDYFFAGLTPHTKCIDPLDYDYALKEAGKALLWAAGRGGKVQVGRPMFGSESCFFTKPMAGVNGEWSVAVNNLTPAALPATVELALHGRGPGSPTVQSQNVQLKPGTNTVKFPATLGCPGTLFADARIMLGGKVADWAAGAIEVDQSYARISAATLDKPSYHPGERPVVTVEANRGYQSATRGAVNWRLFDVYARELACSSTPLEFGTLRRGQGVLVPARPGRTFSPLPGASRACLREPESPLRRADAGTALPAPPQTTASPSSYTPGAAATPPSPPSP